VGFLGWQTTQLPGKNTWVPIKPLQNSKKMGSFESLLAQFLNPKWVNRQGYHGLYRENIAFDHPVILVLMM